MIYGIPLIYSSLYQLNEKMKQYRQHWTDHVELDDTNGIKFHVLGYFIVSFHSATK